MAPHGCQVVRRLLLRADELYARSEAGIRALPSDCRPGIFAARYIYAGIGGRIRANGHDSVTRRARTGLAQKLGWLGVSLARSAGTMAMPQSAMLYARPLPEVAFLVDAAAERRAPRQSWSDTVCSALAQVTLTDNSRRRALAEGLARPK